MPVLPNVKHEMFAQELAKGRPQGEAYEACGYVFRAENASRLAARDWIQARVAEILGKAAVRAEISISSLTARLVKIADLAESTGTVIDDETGAVIKTSPNHLAVARNAIMDVAKLNGLIVDKAMNATTSLEDLLDGIAAAPSGPEITH